MVDPLGLFRIKKPQSARYIALKSGRKHLVALVKKHDKKQRARAAQSQAPVAPKCSMHRDRRPQGTYGSLSLSNSALSPTIWCEKNDSAFRGATQRFDAPGLVRLCKLTMI